MWRYIIGQGGGRSCSLPEHSEAVGQDSSIEVVNDGQAQQAEHRHTER